MMDCFVLMIERKILKCTATHASIALGAFLGSFLTCLVICLPIPYAFIKFILFHGVISVLMVRVGLKITFGKSFLKALLLLYISSFLMGGVFTWLHQYMRVGSLFFALAVGSYFLVQGIWKFITYIQRIQNYKCKVTLYIGSRQLTVDGMIDTGNSLADPLTGKPVCVMSRKEAKQAFGEEKIHSVRYIPYHSVGKEEGTMPIIEFQKMCIHRADECWIERPLIGIGDEHISAQGEYAIILNPEIF